MSHRRPRMRIVYKIVVPQFALALLLLIVAIPAINSITRLGMINNTAERGYAYGSHAVEALDAQLRQLRSVSNYVAENAVIQRFLSPEGGLDEDLMLITRSILPSEERRNVVGEISLYALETSSAAARAALPIWSSEDALNGVFLARKYGGIQWVLIHAGDPDRLHLARPILCDGVEVGMLVIRSSEELLGSLDDVFTLALPCSYVLISEDGEAAWQSNGIDAAALERLLSTSAMEGYHSEGSRITYVINSSELRVKVVAEQTEVFTGAIDPSARRVTLISFLFLMVCVLATIPLFISISRRITHVADRMALAAPVEEPVRGTDEIAQLTRAYNDLLVRMERAYSQMQEAKLMQQEAAYHALQAQIQPHFLYNTLETLRMMAESSDDEALADTIAQFGRLLRASLSPHGDTTTIARELENVRDYLGLYMLRVPRLKCDIEAEERVLGVDCPRFILQPLVENAVKHGVERRGGGQIRVFIGLVDGGAALRMEVINDGEPLPVERIEHLNRAIAEGRPAGGEGSDSTRSTQIGLSNVSMRIRMFYGEGTRLVFIPCDEGCCCRMDLVLRQKDKTTLGGSTCA